MDALAGALSGARCGIELQRLANDDPTPYGIGQFYLAVDPSWFGDPAAFRRTIDRIIRDVRETPAQPGVERVYAPGERSHARWIAAREAGLSLPAALDREVLALTRRPSPPNTRPPQGAPAGWLVLRGDEAQGGVYRRQVHRHPLLQGSTTGVSTVAEAISHRSGASRLSLSSPAPPAEGSVPAGVSPPGETAASGAGGGRSGGSAPRRRGGARW